MAKLVHFSIPYKRFFLDHQKKKLNGKKLYLNRKFVQKNNTKTNKL